jgi:hypothetical protein
MRGVASLLVLAACLGAAEEAAPAPLSAQAARLAEARRIVDAAFSGTGKLAEVSLAHGPLGETLPQGYAERFGRSVAELPYWFEAELRYQRQQAKVIAPRAGIDPRAIDLALDRLDLQAGIIVDELCRPDILLRAFAVYRQQGSPLQPKAETP